jgi:hypothetical protein
MGNILSIFAEKSRNAFHRSRFHWAAIFFTGEWSWWSFRLAKSFGLGGDMLEVASQEGTAMVGFVIFWLPSIVFVYLVFPLINVLSNVFLSAATFLVSLTTFLFSMLFVVPILTLAQVLLHNIRQTYSIPAYIEGLKELDAMDFHQCVEQQLQLYDATSEISQELKDTISNTRSLEEKKAELCLFMQDKRSGDNYNAGRGVTGHLISRMDTFFYNRDKCLSEQKEKSVANAEESGYRNYYRDMFSHR